MKTTLLAIALCMLTSKCIPIQLTTAKYINTFLLRICSPEEEQLTRFIQITSISNWLPDPIDSKCKLRYTTNYYHYTLIIDRIKNISTMYSASEDAHSLGKKYEYFTATYDAIESKGKVVIMFMSMKQASGLLYAESKSDMIDFTRTLNNAGFHKMLSSNFTFHGNLKGCTLNFMEFISDELYTDIELIQTNYSVDGFIDFELPKSKSENHLVTLKPEIKELQGNYSVDYTISVHTRYQEPNDIGYEPVRISFPMIVSVCGGIPQLIEDSRVNDMFTKMPVGKNKHKSIVFIITAISISAGMILLFVEASRKLLSAPCKK